MPYLNDIGMAGGFFLRGLLKKQGLYGILYTIY